MSIVGMVIMLCGVFTAIGGVMIAFVRKQWVREKGKYVLYGSVCATIIGAALVCFDLKRLAIPEGKAIMLSVSMSLATLGGTYRFTGVVGKILPRDYLLHFFAWDFLVASAISLFFAVLSLPPL